MPSSLPPRQSASSDAPLDSKGRRKFRDDILPWPSRKPEETFDKPEASEDGGDVPRRSTGTRSIWFAAAGILVVAAVIVGITVILRLEPATAHTVAEATPAKTPASGEGEKRQQAWDSIEGFLTATTVEEKLAFVAWPEKVAEKMRAYYRRFSDEPSSLRGFQFLSSQPTFATTNSYRLAVTVDEAAAHTTYYALLEDDDSLRIDWECLVAYGPMSLADFIAMPPSGPIEMRVTAVPSDYYNYEFLDASRFQAYEIRTQVDPETVLQAYAEKGTACHAELAAAIRGPNPVPVMLLLAPPATPGQPFCRIERLVKPHWSGE